MSPSPGTRCQGKGRQTPREGDIGSRPLLTEAVSGHLWLRPAVPLIGQTTRHTPPQESVIASGIPELTTGACAEVGARIGG